METCYYSINLCSHNNETSRDQNLPLGILVVSRVRKSVQTKVEVTGFGG